MNKVNNNVYSVLLAGGTGTRLWPVSRKLYPKQLVSFIGKLSLVQVTIKRLCPMFSPEKIRIVCGQEHFYEITRHTEEIGIKASDKIICEPCGRNTGPAILMAVLSILKKDPDAVLCIFPADHVIIDVNLFYQKIQSAVSLAEEGYIVTFGIKPKYPETGYGYIEGSDSVAHGAFHIKRFVEKPDIQTAIKYIEAGNFFWNSGMFAFKASIIAHEFELHQPDLYNELNTILSHTDLPSTEDYQRLPDISIDYAVMEKTEKGVVLPSDFGWSDIGSWKSLYDFTPKDKDNNVLKGDIIANKTQNCLIMGEDRLIAVNHIKDTVIIETPDAIFVSDINMTQDVKSIFTTLKNAGRKECLQHKKLYLEWGNVTSLEQKNDYKVDRLEIYPDSSLNINANASATHIIVTKGTVNIIKEGNQHALKTGQSQILVKGDSVKLKNCGQQPVYVVQVQM